MIKGRKRSSSDNEINPPERKTIKMDEKSLRSNKFKAKSTLEAKNFLKNKGRFNKGVTDVKPEKTDWHKFKQEKKELKVKRKKAKNTYEIFIEAKHMYEQLKCKKSEKKSELVAKLYKLLNGDLLKKVVMAHDTARIVQCMLKFASPALRETISNELLPVVIEMAVSKYSHFCLLRMFKYGSPEIKNKLVDSFMGHIVRLASHKISSKILDHAYLTVATSKQKAHMRQEFYGDLYKKSKDDAVTKLSDTYKDTTHMKAAIMGSVKSNLDHVANKKLVDNSLVHAVILEYLEVCEEDKMEEIVTMYSSLIPLLLSTREGCRAAIICFWHSSSKNRRAIVKAVKDHLVKICTHEQGHVFIIAVINSMDDTKATKKAIFDTIYADLKTVASNQWGRRVIEWFISPADTNSFHPQFITYMEEGLKYGKKDKDIRRKEIFEQIEIPIAKAISDEPEFWFSEGHIGLVTANIINKLGSTCFENAVRGLLSLVCKHDWSVSVPEEILEAAETEKTKNCKVVAGIEDPGLHIALKKIIKCDPERKNQMLQTFGSMLSDLVPDQTLTYWSTVNRGCFILLNIIENNEEKTIPKLIDFLKAHKSNLRKQTTIGAKLLLKKLEN